MKTTFKLCLLVLLCLGLSACATSRFYQHEGSNNSFQGRGGSRFTVEGIDVWFIGEPDRRYTILGYIEEPYGAQVDEDHKRVDASVLKKAHEVGATALIEVVTETRPDSSFTTGGLFGDRHGFGMGLGFGVPISTRQVARYTAIKYLDQ